VRAAETLDDAALEMRSFTVWMSSILRVRELHVHPHNCCAVATCTPTRLLTEHSACAECPPDIIMFCRSLLATCRRSWQAGCCCSSCWKRFSLVVSIGSEGTDSPKAVLNASRIVVWQLRSGKRYIYPIECLEAMSDDDYTLVYLHTCPHC